jgi:hypothetical protein
MKLDPTAQGVNKGKRQKTTKNSVLQGFDSRLLLGRDETGSLSPVQIFPD